MNRRKETRGTKLDHVSPPFFFLVTKKVFKKNIFKIAKQVTRQLEQNAHLKNWMYNLSFAKKASRAQKNLLLRSENGKTEIYPEQNHRT